MFKIIITVILIFSFHHFLAQADSALPITVIIKVDSEYEVKRGKEAYGWEMRKYGDEINSDTLKQKCYDITIEIKDTSDKPIKIWLMTCDWELSFLVNNTYMYFQPHDCLHNFPELIELKQGKSQVYKTRLLNLLTSTALPGAT